MFVEIISNEHKMDTNFDSNLRAEKCHVKCGERIEDSKSNDSPKEC